MPVNKRLWGAVRLIGLLSPMCVALECLPAIHLFPKPSTEPIALLPQEGVAADITLSVYSDGWGTLLDTMTIATEGSVTISVEEDGPVSDSGKYYVYAQAQGFYTGIYECFKGQSISVDLDAVDNAPQSLTGVIFGERTYSPDRCLANASLNLAGPNGFLSTITTDAQGRYGIANLPPGVYTLQFTYENIAFSFDLACTEDAHYEDLSFLEPTQSEAPSQPTALSPQEGVATDITLSIYSDGWGTLLDTMMIPTEGSVTISVDEENPYEDPPPYYVYARAHGFYTELYRCTKGESISVDLDAVNAAPQSLTGVIFREQVFFSDRYLANTALDLAGPDGFLSTITTDAQGRYGIANLPLGAYTLQFTYQNVAFSFDLTCTDDAQYEDLSFVEPLQAAAPNVYLYPETESDIEIQLAFPSGGSITFSEPAYDSGWRVRVSPNGTIDGRYGYLFYEAMVPPIIQNQTGWLLDGSQLETELRQLLSQLGLVGREIDDFLGFWLPVLEPTGWYAVYPMDAESHATLIISPRPSGLLRVLLAVRPLPVPISIPPPTAPQPFARKGFTVVEWGVVLVP